MSFTDKIHHSQQLDRFTVCDAILIGVGGGGLGTQQNYRKCLGFWRNLNICNSAQICPISTVNTFLKALCLEIIYHEIQTRFRLLGL